MSKIPKEPSVVIRRHANGVSVTAEAYGRCEALGGVFVFNNHKDLIAHILATLDFPEGSHAAAEKTSK